MKNLKLFEEFSSQGSSSLLPLAEVVQNSMRRSYKKPILLVTDGTGEYEADQVADDLGMDLIYVDASMVGPEIFGMPRIAQSMQGGNRGATYYGRPSGFRDQGVPTSLPSSDSKDPMILLISGIDKADKEVFNSVMKLAAFKKTGNYTLPENCILVATVSDPEELDFAIQDRFLMAKP